MAVKTQQAWGWKVPTRSGGDFCRKEEGFRDGLFPHLLFLKSTPKHITRNENINICLKHNQHRELESGWCWVPSHGSQEPVKNGTRDKEKQTPRPQSRFLVAVPTKPICRGGYFLGSKYVICQVIRAKQAKLIS